MIPNCAATRHAHFVLDGRGPAYLEPPSLDLWPAVNWQPDAQRSRRVDLHCHSQNPDVMAKVAHMSPLEHEPSWVYANALTRETNRRQGQDRAAKLSTIEVRLKDMDRMGIDIWEVVEASATKPYGFMRFEPGPGVMS